MRVLQSIRARDQEGVFVVIVAESFLEVQCDKTDES